MQDFLLILLKKSVSEDFIELANKFEESQLLNQNTPYLS